MSMERLFEVEEQEDFLRPMTPRIARGVIASQRESGKLKLKASVTEGSPPEGVPLYEDDDSRVRLFPTIKEATDYLKSRKDALSELGWEHTHGTIGRGVFEFRKDSERTVLALDKVQTKRKEQG